MAISQEIIEQVRDRISLAEVVSEIVSLKRSGKNLTGLCPFHSEKTPSFFVNDDDGFFRCFGCGKKGSVFDFVMESRGLSFPESVKLLARRAGVEIPESEASQKESEQARKKRFALREVLREAVKIYSEFLHTEKLAEPARQYLFSKRKLSPESVATFELGYAPESELLVERIQRGLKERKVQLFGGEAEYLDVLHSAGIVTRRSSGGVFDTFHGRVIYPIAKSDGSVVALAGRLLAESQTRPKYINSIETLLYSKSRTLYGLAQAMPAIRTSRELFLVEGYMDVIAMHQAGITNVVAACGTAITPDHVRVLKRLVDRVIVVFDGDAAGARAAAAAFPVFLNSELDVSGVSLPSGDDPGSLVEKGEVDSLRNQIYEHRDPIVDIYLRQHLGDPQQEGEATRSPARAGKAAQELAKLLVKVTNPVEREFLSKRVAEHLGVSQEAFLALLRKTPAGKKGAPTPSETAGDPREEGEPVRGSAKKPVGTVSRGTPSNTISRSTFLILERYASQLIVAVLCEPQLAAVVLQSPSLVGSRSPDELDEGLSPRGAVVPDAVRSALEAIAERKPEGIAHLIHAKTDPNSTHYQACIGELQGLLELYGIEGEKLIREAISQATVGGSKPRDLVGNATKVAAQLSLREEVVQIRQEEAGAEDLEARALLAQKKLLKRRNLESMKGD